MKFLCALCVLVGLAASAAALDREAFTFTAYHLNVTLEPEQHRLEVRGIITLRNDSRAPQKNLSLQISSTLAWHSIQLDGKPLEFISQPYYSDIDHTGALSEAIVTLPREIPPQATLDLQIGYEGTIARNTSRLTQVGMPEAQAQHTDWDQIGESFTAVRGVGYVTWYPVAMNAASLAEGNSVFETVDRWKLRHADSSMSLVFESTAEATILFSGTPDLFSLAPEPGVVKVAAFSMARFGVNVPAFAMAGFQKLKLADGLSTLWFLPGHDAPAKAYGDLTSKLSALVFSGLGEDIQIIQLPDAEAAPFATGKMALLPFQADPSSDDVALVYALARQCFFSPRAWIADGFAHYEQAAYIERQSGRKAALQFLGAHLDELAVAEKSASQPALANAPDGLDAQTKAMYVWWMLRDMLRGDEAFTLARKMYPAAPDQDAAYLPKLIQKQSPTRDLSWFFDDWIYHDRGLPDFRVDAVFPSATAHGSYLVTVTVENLGGAGAEVPVTIRAQDSEATQRLEVRGKSKNSFRVLLPSYPVEVVVNDGSVPESDMTNNEFKVPPEVKSAP